MSTLDYVATMFEEIRDQNKAVLEAVGDIQRKTAGLPQILADVSELKTDMKIVKAVITDMSKQLNNHDHRTTRLEGLT